MSFLQKTSPQSEKIDQCDKILAKDTYEYETNLGLNFEFGFLY